MTSEKRIFNLTRRTQREENEWKKNLRASCFVFAVQVFTKVWRPSWRLRFCFLFFFSIVRFAELSVGFPPFFSFCCRFTGEGGACRLGGPGWQPIKRSQKRTESVLQKNLKKKTKTKQERSVPRASLPSTCWLPFFFSFSSLGTRMGSVGQQRTNKPKSNKKTKIRVSLRKGRVVGFAFGSSSSLADFVRFVFRFFVSPLCACSCV